MPWIYNEQVGIVSATVMKSTLSVKAKYLDAVLSFYAGCMPSTAKLAAILVCSPRSIRYYRAELMHWYATKGEVKSGWKIEKEWNRAGAAMDCHYTMNSDINKDSMKIKNRSVNISPPVLTALGVIRSDTK